LYAFFTSLLCSTRLADLILFVLSEGKMNLKLYEDSKHEDPSFKDTAVTCFQKLP